jgi:hypothetical protein
MNLLEYRACGVVAQTPCYDSHRCVRPDTERGALSAILDAFLL